MSKQSFYFQFEQRFRGSRELVKSRLQVYLAFVLPFVDRELAPAAIDLGCGRGEWLELLDEKGFNAQGVDLDANMVGSCKANGLPISKGDALKFLETLDDESQCVISALHLVEHLPFATVTKLVEESLRTLVPGGILILETPNPENLMVGAGNFYLDPTHIRPIPPPLLAFLPDFFGFQRHHILRLQEPRELAEGRAPQLLDVLESVSPDYGVVAQKSADRDYLARFDDAFDREYGLRLGDLANRYDEAIAQRFSSVENRINDSLTTKALLEEKINQVVSAQAGEQIQRHRAELAEAAEQQQRTRADAAEARIKIFLNSGSWRITAPLRWLRRLVLRLTPQAFRPKLELLVPHAARHARRHPWLRDLGLSVLNRFPDLKARLLTIANASAASHDSPACNVPSEPDHLTPHARQIHADLKAAIARHHKDAR